MKQLLTIFMVLAVTVVFGQRQEATLEHRMLESMQTEGADLKDNDEEEEPVGVWIHWDDMIPFGLLGAGIEWEQAIRFEPGDISAFDDFELTRIRVFVGHMPDYAYVTVYQGADVGDLEQIVKQPFEPVDMAWNLIHLDESYLLDTSQELWIGVIWGDFPDNFPGVRDEVTDHVGKGDMIRFGDGDWMSLTEAYGFQGDWNLHGFIEGDYNVTFNLEMSYATFDGGPFDPDDHDVFLSGSFAEWPTPGSDTLYQLKQMTSLEVQHIIHEDFDAGAIPDGWLNIDANGDGRHWELVTTPSFQPHSGDWALRSESWAGADIPQDNWLFTPQIYVPFDDYQLSFFVKAQDPNYPAENYSVLVSTGTSDPDDFETIHTETLSSADWKQVTIDLDAYEGHRIYIAFRHHDSNQLSILLDDIAVTGTPALMYQLAIENLDLGVHQYKYFIVPGDEPTWDYSEWVGDPNRGIIVTGEMAMHDMWAEQVTYDVVFHVVDEAGEPIEGAEFMFNGEEATEGDEAGVFEFEVIEGIYEYSVAKDTYHTVADEVEVTGDQEIVVTLPLYRTVTFEIYNEAEEAITDAVVTFAGVTNEAGDYVFENVVAGTYDYTIEADGYMRVAAEFTVTDDVDHVDITASVTMLDAYYITFNLDMTGVTFTAYGEEVAFNPEFHKVFLSGPEFEIPGANANFRLHLDEETGMFTQTIPFAEGEYLYKYYIVIYGTSWDYPEWEGDPYRPLIAGPDFGDYTINDVWDDYEEVPDPVLYIDEDFEDGVWPENWRNIDLDGDGRAWEYVTAEGAGALGGDFFMLSRSWDGSPLEPDNWLITPQIDVAADDYLLTFWIKTQDPAWPSEKYSIMVSTGEPIVPGVFQEIYTETLTSDDADWKEVSVDLSEFYGELIFIAFRHWDSVDWFQIRLDAISVSGTVDVADIAPEVTSSIFPNPARDQLTVRSTGNISNVEVFNLTGHKVYDANVNDNSAVINVAGFSRGIYILRLQTEQGIENHKFQVIR